MGDWTAIVAEPDFVESCVLVAVIVTLPDEPGAVKSPLELIAPALAAHFTAELKLPVPCTCAVHCEVPPVFTDAGLQVAETEAMVDAAACTFTVDVPDFVASCLLVAVTVTLPDDPGAVKSPPELIVPPLAVHCTAVLKLPVPCTCAVHCEVPPGFTVVGLQAVETEVMVDAAVCTVTVASPDVAVSCTLVAVTVTIPGEPGAVKAPLELMVPELAVHLTAGL